MNSRWTLQAMMIRSICETEGLCKNGWKGNYANRGSCEFMFCVRALQFPTAGWVCNRKACFCPWGSQRHISPLIVDHKASELRHFTFKTKDMKVRACDGDQSKPSRGSFLERCLMHFSIIVVIMSSPSLSHAVWSLAFS